MATVSLSKLLSLMKKIFASMGIALAATLSLSNCTKQIEAPVTPEQDGTPFEVSALLTKTTNDNYGTKWAEGDGINVFHAEAGATTYTSDNKFTLSDATTGTFKGTLTGTLDGAKTYDWYAFYPYDSHVTTPASTTSGYVTVGGKSQTQTGNSSTAHLCGEACPLYGVTTGVNASDIPAFTMKNLSSVICIEVTNDGTDDLTVSNIAFTSTEDIVGTYYIDFTGTTPAYKGSGTSYVSNTAKLAVTGGAAIASGNSAKFYIAIKPHTVASGSTLKLSVNGYEKTTTVSKETVFEAGKIKTVKFSAVGTGEKVLIIDGTKLTSTATTAESTLTYDGIDVVFSKGAKSLAIQTGASNNFSTEPAILIGKNGAYIYNKTAIPGTITKFEIYSNKGASTKVSVGVNFSATAISAYSASAANTYTATLSTADAIYDCTDKLPADAQYFWYQVTNGNNSQIQFRITYK